MLKSMTGYGREQAQIGGKDILVEIRSVNHRYYEFSSRIPRAYGYLDDKLKSFLTGSVSRGKVEVSVTINYLEDKSAQIQVNQAIANGYVDALRAANIQLGLQDDLTLSKLAKFPDIFRMQKIAEDETEIWDAVSTVASGALRNFVSMRELEGQRLQIDLAGKLDIVTGMVQQIEQTSPSLTEQYRTRLHQKLTELLGDTNIDEQRILTEAAIYSEKTAVDEETVRLHSHIFQFRSLLESEEPVGRKLDFLIQEMNREVNTIGSKAQDLTITRIVVDLKSEIEKLREQIQNIE